MTNKLENIMQDVRDFRDDIYCLSTDTNQPNLMIVLVISMMNEILDKFEEIKKESEE